ncbi:hypothetical protein B0A48_13155 [Cryoendolithus antarcticus]|uniref:Asparagine synthetase domain-containing protein n=1 Tax=Cryoendolithus antarcticus TaxID=1507870 RepID=A0A1V8SNC5_9PEZI|nr:hypothetical protein B0A48_13155 [Cryoendolithus antarcticus]
MTYYFTVQEGLDAVCDTIYHLEAFDREAVSAAVPFFLLARKIKATGIKMIMTGLGSGGLYDGLAERFESSNDVNLPTSSTTCVQKLRLLDCAQLHKTAMTWGIESRMPFADTEMLDLQYSLRASWDTSHLPYDGTAMLQRAFQTPIEIDRQMGSLLDPLDNELWSEALQMKAKRRVLPAEYNARSERWPIEIPDTLESYWFRDVYDGYFKATLRVADEIDDC